MRRIVPPAMRFAIFHDYFDKIGGGEKAMLTLARALDADLFTTHLRPEVLARLGGERVRTHDLGPLVLQAPLKQIHASWRFARAVAPDFDAYVFSGNWAHYAGGRHEPGVLYCYTPVRAFYDRRAALLASLPPPQRPLYRAWTRVHSRFDRASVDDIDVILAISENVRRRIRRYYGRDARIVYPPVATSRFHFRELGDFWLSVNRLYPEKRVDLQLEVFRRLPGERLVVVGGWAPGDHSARYVAGLDPPPNVTLLGEITEDELVDLYARCRGVLATAADEDFGLTPIEAMASGKAVLATREGGYPETVRDGRTGWLLPPDPEAFVQKIQSLDDQALLAVRAEAEAQSRRFGEEPFATAMRAILREVADGASF
ncbi:MAG: glycosyltransferase [Thermoplasmata archaeon]